MKKIVVKHIPKDAFIWDDTLFQPTYKSIMQVGNFNLMNTKHFNRFQKFMYKLCFSICIVDIEEEKVEDIPDKIEF